MSETPKINAKPHIALLIILSGLNPVALNIFLPSMPNLTENLNTTYAISQLTLTLYLAALAITQLILGPLSDKYGRRPILLVGVAIYAISSLACGFALSIEQLIIGRILQAAGSCAGVVVTRAIVRDLYDRDKAASLIGYMTMVMALMPLVAPVIGGYIDQWASWRTSFYLISFIGLLAFIASYKSLHETNKAPVTDIDFKNIFGKYGALMGEKQYLGYVFGMAFGAGVFYCFIAGAPFLTTKMLGLSPSEYGFYFMIVSCGYIFGSFLSGRLSVKLGNYKLINLSSIILTIGIILLLTAYSNGISHPVYIFIPMMVVACSNGLAIPSAIAGALSIRPDIAGTAAGLAGFMQVFVGAIATFMVGYFHDGTAAPMVFGMSISAILSVLFFKFWVNKIAK